ncbi:MULTISPECIES: hypothetical protein [Burkholderiaceae]|jgi:hypothetical protein|uniref:Uncharacterized protein n=1 Tax=Burkholderia aenigmatica TaxID=2015348 RepID=A0A6J5JGE9_9BURK|nr:MULTISPECIES: hypothetical protein [Burkholderiaceae]MBR8498359.1 hypothetical protein [Burkholderia cenocepacia]UAL00292.1 hypothetical protein K8O84_02630 [Cupriavidus pauculus]CAB3970699.1 hypothetical protein BLA3211_06075 [Burkholderia aenigmatica]
MTTKKQQTIIKLISILLLASLVYYTYAQHDQSFKEGIKKVGVDLWNDLANPQHFQG